MTPDDRETEVLRYWVENAPYRLARRAWLVFEYLNGESARSLASSVAMTEQRVLEVIYRYEQSGLVGLFDSKRVGKPVASDESGLRGAIALGNLLGTSLSGSQIARELNVSPDAVWRQARLTNIVINRARSRFLRARTHLTELIPILGCVLGPDAQLLALSSSIKRIRLEPTGVLDSVSPEFVASTRTEKTLSDFYWLEQVIERTLDVFGHIPKRGALERRLRFLKRLDYFEKRLSAPVTIYLSGNVRSEAFQDWVKILQRSEFWLAGDKSRYRLFVHFEDLISSALTGTTQNQVKKKWLIDIPNKIHGAQEEIVWYRDFDTEVRPKIMAAIAV
jgi:hypothetical protein